MIGHVSHWNASGTIDGAIGNKLRAAVAHLFNNDLGTGPVYEFQIVGRSEIMHPFGNCVESDYPATYLKTFDFGNSEAGHD